MGYSSLDQAPRELFFQHFTGKGRVPSGAGTILWFGLFLFLVFLGLASMIVHSYVIFPWHVIVVEVFMYTYLLVTFLFYLIFSRKRMVIRYPSRTIMALFLWASNFAASTWFLLSVFAILLIGAGGLGKVEFMRGIFVSIWSLMMLGVGATMMIWMRRRMVKRIIGGHFREGGSGFWGDYKWKKNVPKISAVAFAISLILVFVSRQVSRLGGGIEWNSSYGPLLIVVASLIISCIFFLFAYLFTLISVSTYCMKRFGIEIVPTPKTSIEGEPQNEDTLP